MNISTSEKWLLIAAGVQSLLFQPLRAAAVEPEINDSGMAAAVEDGLLLAEGICPNNVDASVRQGIVTLSGSVDNVLAQQRALKVAESIRGVRGVIDRTIVTPVSRSDADIRQDVLAALRQDPATESYQVAVSVQDGVATLTGSVASYEENQLATQVAEGVKGVKRVQNNLTISYRGKRTDAEIAADVTARLQWDIWINGDLINVAVKAGKVTLTGAVGSLISKGRAADDAWVNGVTSVDDSGVQIEPWAGNDTRQKFTHPTVADAEIRKAIVAALHLDPRVSPFSPDVTVEDGLVILGGGVGSLKAKAAAEQDARNTVGVWEVNNYLKVRPKGQPTDAEMEKQLKAALLWNPLLASSTIDVAVLNRTAYLSGSVDTNFQKTESQEVAARIKGVSLVRNRLKVLAESSAGEVAGPGHPPYQSDEEIKKKIERAFARSPYVNPAAINVAVHGGVATLTGEVGTWLGWGEADTGARESGAAYVIDRIMIKKHPW